MVGHDLSMCILYRFHGWLIFARVIALFMFVWPYVCSHILCTQLVICLLSHFIDIWYLGWPWSEHAHIIPISRMVDFCESYIPFHVCLTIRPSSHLVYATSHLSCRILFIFGILVGHDLSMHILYRFHGWLIIARVIALFMFVWPYVCPHILCMQLVIYLVAFYSYLVSWLAMIWACTYYTDFMDGWYLRES